MSFEARYSCEIRFKRGTSQKETSDFSEKLFMNAGLKRSGFHCWTDHGQDVLSIDEYGPYYDDALYEVLEQYESIVESGTFVFTGLDADCFWKICFDPSDGHWKEHQGYIAYEEEGTSVNELLREHRKMLNGESPTEEH